MVAAELEHRWNQALEHVHELEDRIAQHVGHAPQAPTPGLERFDRAGWHTTKKLEVPDNITLMPLPPRAPDLNPVDNIWRFLRQNWLSNRIFRSYDDIVEHCSYAWIQLTEQPWTPCLSDREIGHRWVT